MKTVTIEIEAPRGAAITHELFASSREVLLPGGAVATREDLIERRGLDFPSLLTIALQIPADVAAGLIAAWLYDKLKDHGVRTLRIDRQEITLNKGEIEKILIEHIESK